MQFNFSKTANFYPAFNGNKALPAEEQIVCTLKPLPLTELLNLIDAIKSQGLDGKIDTEANVERLKPIIKSYGHLLPQYVKIERLKAQDGAEITVQDVVDYAHFVPLASEILFQLITISSLQEADTKNLSAPQG